MSESKAKEFMNRIIDLAREDRKDRGALAALRRSLAFQPGTYLPAFRHVEPWVQNEDGWRREAYYLAAGLFALYSRHGSDTLAQAMGQLYRKRRSGSIEARFFALLDADRDQLPDRLRRAVLLVRAEGLAIDWVRLLSDLLEWLQPDRPVQRRWAREFYRAASRAEEAPQQEEVASA